MINKLSIYPSKMAQSGRTHLSEALNLNALIISVLTLSATLGFADAPQGGIDPSPFKGIEVIEETLSNGLTVIMSPDHRLPTVAVEVRYLVGSAHEVKGRSGFAHLFEHLMFQGSKSYDKEYFTPFTPIGGKVNGTTNSDRTNYYEQVPAEALELALWMESDRMEGLLEALTQEKLDNQRDVVKNERRQRYENTPYGMVWKLFANELYPEGHPYQHTTIGSHKDLSAATLEDVKRFFRTYYVPSNAILTIVGDFEPKEASRLARKYFGALKAGTRAPMPTASFPKLSSDRSVTFKDQVKLPRVYFSWHSPALYQDGDAGLDILATILADGKSSRLYKPLVYEQKIAKDVSAYQVSRAMSGHFVISATVAPGHTLDEVSEALKETLKIALSTPPSQDEFDRALNGWRKSFYQRIEGVMSRAQLLSTYKHLLGDAKKFDRDLSRYTDLSPQAIHETATRWLMKERSLRIVALPEEEEVIELPDRSAPPKLAQGTPWTPPEMTSWKMKNGLEVWYLKQDQAPLTSMQLIIDGGSSADPQGKAGLTALMVDLLDEGAGERDALAISEAFQRLATDYGGSTSTDGVVFNLNLLTEQLAPSLSLLAEILTTPRFTPEDFKRRQRQRKAQMLTKESNPRSVRNTVMRRVLFGTGYGGMSSDGTPTTLEAITLDDVRTQYRRQIQPQGATLIVVGSVEEEALKSSLERSFSSWSGAPTVTIRPLTPNADPSAIHWVDFPGSTQSAIALVRIIKGTQESTSSFDELLFNRVYGGEFTSRLNMNLREDKGYTYGAYSGLYRYQRAGIFFSGAMVKGSVTLPSLQEAWTELTDIQGKRPVTADELARVKGGLIKGFPNRFETLSSVKSTFAQLRMERKSMGWLKEWLKGVNVTDLKAVQTASSLAQVDQLQVIVAGDRAQLIDQFQGLERPVYFYNARGERLTPKSADSK